MPSSGSHMICAGNSRPTGGLRPDAGRELKVQLYMLPLACGYALTNKRLDTQASTSGQAQGGDRGRS
jgi:hypothetical protein